ncbi:MAG: DoxX family membrane protein [Elusimicrobia bacterium]|nr:DoxX family membrane protein [Elusimicrobiota bacterium]
MNPQEKPSRVPWPALALAARFLLCAVFLVSGLHKTLAPAEEFAAVIEAYQLLPADVLLPFAHLVPFAELLLAFSLAAGFLTRLSSAASGALSLMFFIALGSTLARGIPLENCGCFGSIHLTPAQAMTVDVCMMALAAVAFLRGRSRFSLDAWIESGF